MFAVWDAPYSRRTRYIDLLRRRENPVPHPVLHVVATIQEVCEQPIPEDGLRSAAETVVGERIIEVADYEGVQVRFRTCQ